MEALAPQNVRTINIMGEENDGRAEFVRLLAEHRHVTVRLCSADRALIGEDRLALQTYEMQLRSRIIAYEPLNRSEAYRKVEHVAQLIAFGIHIDRGSVAHVMRSIDRFL